MQYIKNLPDELQDIIYSYDDTYIKIFNIVLKDIKAPYSKFHTFFEYEKIYSNDGDIMSVIISCDNINLHNTNFNIQQEFYANLENIDNRRNLMWVNEIKKIFNHSANNILKFATSDDEQYSIELDIINNDNNEDNNNIDTNSYQILINYEGYAMFCVDTRYSNKGIGLCVNSIYNDIIHINNRHNHNEIYDIA
jgi:hypothetical protein